MSNPKTFSKRIINNALAGILDLVFSKITNILIFVLLVRLLGERDIAAIGIGTSYLILVAYLDLAPIRVLLRDYPKISSDQSERDRFLTAMFLFWCFQAITMLIVGFCVANFILDHLNYTYIKLLFIALTLDFIALTLDGWIKTIFYSAIRQGTATRIGLCVSVMRFASLSSLFFYPSLKNYSLILIAISLCGCLIWFSAFIIFFKYRPKLNKNDIRGLFRSLLDYGVWYHLNRSFFDTLLVVGTAILAWFASASEVADYSIALRFTSLLLILPGQLAQAIQLSLSHTTENKIRFDVLNAGLKTAGLIGFFQIVFIMILGNWILNLFFGKIMNDNILLYVRLISIGSFFMVFSYPFFSAMNNFTNLFHAWSRLFLPLLIIGVAIYYIAAFTAGARGMAVANVIVYSMTTIGMYIFLSVKWPFPIRLKTLSLRERELLKQMFRKSS
jgi:O-antigen/teichoic acid export membrane protein